MMTEKKTRDVKLALRNLMDAAPGNWTAEKVTKTGYDLNLGPTNFHTRTIGPTIVSAIRAAMVPLDKGGLGWTIDKVRESMRWEARSIPRGMAAHDEVLLLQVTGL